MLLIIVGFIMVRCYGGFVRIGSRCSDREEQMVTRIIVLPSTASYATPELDVKCFIFSVGSTLMGCCQAIACDYNQLKALDVS